MGKAAKTRRAEQRKSQKRARKAQQQALYDSYKKAGSNRKKKGNTAATKGGVSTTKHTVANCGNVGCKRCFPDLAMPRLNAPHARLAPVVKRKKKEGPRVIPSTLFGAAFNGLNPVGLNPLGLSPTEEAFFVNPATGKPE